MYTLQCKLCKDVATFLFLLKWCTSGSNTNIAVDVCAIPDNISEIVQKIVHEVAKSLLNLHIIMVARNDRVVWC